MATSRSALEFQERAGLKILQAGPRPRLPAHALKVHGVPLHPPQPEQVQLLDAEGANPTDRGETRPWPHQT